MSRSWTIRRIVEGQDGELLTFWWRNSEGRIQRFASPGLVADEVMFGDAMDLNGLVEFRACLIDDEELDAIEAEEMALGRLG